MSSDDNILLIGIGGASCSGKSTLANHLANVLNCPIVHQDKFYKPDSEIPQVDGMANWDCPEAIDMVGFVKFLKEIKSRGISKSVLGENRPRNELSLDLFPEIQALALQITSRIDSLKQIVLLDGFLIYENEAVVSLLDGCIFMNAPYETLKSRRDARSHYVTIEGTWADPPDYFEKIVWPSYLEHNAAVLIKVKQNTSETPLTIGQRHAPFIPIPTDENDIPQAVTKALQFLLTFISSFES